MDFRDLSDFICIAETRNITRAAESLFTSQQALSKSIHRLEEELGVPLFMRSRSGVTLTEYGRQFLSYAGAALQQYQTVTASLRRIRPEESDPVSFGYATGMFSYFLPEFLGHFMRAHPQAYFMMNSYPDDVPHRMSAVPGNSICLVSNRLEDDIYRVEQKFTFPLCVALARDNPLAGKAELTWQDLLAVPAIGLNAENEYSAALNRVLSGHGIVPRFILNAAEHEFTSVLMRDFAAVSFYGGPSAVLPPDVCTRPLAGLNQSMSYYLCVEREHICNPTEQAFICELTDALQGK